MERSVIEAAARGDIKAFKRVFDFYLPKMRPVSLRYSYTDFEADDILQEAFIKIFHNLKDFRFEGSFEGWIRRIVVNTALNHNKKNSNYHASEQIEEAMEEEDESITSFEGTEASELMNLIEQLPDGYKTVFNLYVFEDFSHKEIGDILGISEGTSRSQYSKAKKMIKKLMFQATK
jgi:RNA polymerase sigma factor (sigma-70 family)